MNPEQENGGGYHGPAQAGGGHGGGIASTPRVPGLTDLTEEALKTLELLTTNITQLEDKLEIVCISRDESVGNGLEAIKEPDMSRIDSRLNTIIRRINVNNDRILRLLRRVNL